MFDYAHDVLCSLTCDRFLLVIMLLSVAIFFLLYFVCVCMLLWLLFASSEWVWIKFNLYVGWHIIRIRNARAHDLKSKLESQLERIKRLHTKCHETDTELTTNGQQQNIYTHSHLHSQNANDCCIWHNTLALLIPIITANLEGCVCVVLG